MERDDERDRGSNGEKHEGLWRRPQREGFGGPDWEVEGDDDTPRDREPDPRRDRDPK